MGSRNRSGGCVFWGEFSPHSLTSPLPIPRDADRHQPVHFKSLFCELEGWGGPRTGKGSVDSGRGGLRGPRQLHQPQQQGPGRPVQLGGVALVGGARAAVEARAIPALGLVGAALCGEKGLSSPAAPGTRPRSPHPPAHTPGSRSPAPVGPRDGLRTASTAAAHLHRSRCCWRRSGPGFRRASGPTGRAMAGRSPPGSAGPRPCPGSSPARPRSRCWARSSALCPRGRRGDTAEGRGEPVRA